MSSRRRLRIICSSDEDEDDDDVQEIQPPPQQRDDIESQTLNLQDVTLNSNSNNSNTTNPSDSVQIQISDEDFIDALEDLSPSPQSPPPPPPPRTHQTVNSSEYFATSSAGTSETSNSPVNRILEDLGLRLRGEWLDYCLCGLQTAIPGFSSYDVTKKAKICFEKFLQSDMNNCGAGMLPPNVHQMHLVDLPGPFVLQVDEIVNISQPLRERYKKAPAGLKRCLKLSMTDGVQRVFGMEYQPIKDLDALAPAGLKVAICNVNVRHGLLMLVPEVIQVLGGLVDELDAARQRLVAEVNKPPRGNRTRTGVVPPLATRATRAAWPADNNPVSGTSSNPISQNATPMQVDDQGTTPSVNGSGSSNSAVPVHRDHQNATPMHVDDQGTTPPVNGRGSSSSAVPVHREHAAHPLHRVEVEPAIFTRRENIEPLPTNMTKENASSAVPVIRVSDEATPTRVREEVPVPIHREQTSPVVLDDGDVHMVGTEDYRSAFNSLSESPFTYMASLSAKWAASRDKASHVEGKIKCFLTGVKKFQYKQRSTYELQLYVDDGSLISEILVDHNIVQKKIGYSPEEVNAALASSDSSQVQAMKDTMKQFQIFLVNFEGTMRVRINEASTLPVAIEMHQGCPLSDAWLLLRRLKSSNNADLAPQRSPLDPINLSP